MGGGWRQPGLLAAAANYSLDHAEETMSKDHKHAQMLAKGMLYFPSWKQRTTNTYL